MSMVSSGNRGKCVRSDLILERDQHLERQSWKQKDRPPLLMTGCGIQGEDYGSLAGQAKVPCPWLCP